MKKNIIVLAGLILGLFFTSCDEYVDIEPKGLVIPRETADLKLTLNNDITFPTTSRHLWFMDDDIFIADARHAYIQGNGLMGTYIPEIYGFKDEIYDEDEVDSNWLNNYENIAVANYVLNQLPLVNGSESDKLGIEADARFLKSEAYFQLVGQYSRHYGLGDPNEAETGVPMTTNFGDVSEDLTRRSIQEVYDIMIEDMNFVVANHPFTLPEHNFKGSVWAAHGMLARIYLHMGQYQLALDNANAAIDIKDDLIDYPNELPLNAKGSLGRPNRDDFAKTEIMLLRQGTAPFQFAFTPGVGFGVAHYLYLTPDLEAIFDQTNDMRFTDLTIADFAAGGARRYKGWVDMSLSAFVGMTTPEIILIAAECNARLGNTTAAMDNVNYVRLHRINSTDPLIVNLTAANDAEALQHALEEKRRETAFRGVRYFDVKRLNALDNANISLSRTDFDGAAVTLPANHAKWAMPIGTAEINLNPEIKQNPRN